MLEFTKKELIKIQIIDQEVDPDNFDSKGLPSDTHIVMYVSGGKTLYDAVRAYTMVDIFDTYYDKTKANNGSVLEIRSGYGTVRPNLYGKIRPGNADE